MNQQEIMNILPHNESEAMSLREIAQAIGMDTSSYASWIKAEHSLAGILRKLIKWGFVSYVRRKNLEGHRFWYNLYWRNEIRANEHLVASEIISEQV